MRTSFLLTIAMLFGSAAFAQPAAPAPPMVKEGVTVKVSDHVFVIPDGNVGGVPNVGIIVGARATAVVDPGLGVKNGEAVLREVAKVSRNAEVYVITTHFHPEHTTGGAAFPAGTKFVRPKIQQQDVEEQGQGMIDTFASRTPVMRDLLANAKIPPPDVTFDREHAIDLGGVRIRLLALGPTHTRGDTIVFVEGDGVLFSGDITMGRVFLAFMSPAASIGTWLAALDRLESLHPKRIVPSHGEMGDASMMGADREYLTLVGRRAGELKGQGKSLDEASQAVTDELKAKYPDWAQPARLAGTVKSVYAETPR